MARKKKVYEDDDGRTIADMSGITRPRMFIPSHVERDRMKPVTQESVDDRKENRPWEKEDDLMTPRERRWYVLGALKAALLIALTFIAGLGLLIAVLIWVWR